LVQSSAVANIKSQIKRNRQNEAARVRNKSVRSALKTSAKKVRSVAEAGDVEAARVQFQEAARQVDKAVSKGILHKRAAARRKSRLARSLGAAG
jgi:small subunit ribosomal protein S20